MPTEQSATHDRRYDLVIWGASGFTGRLVVEYLAENYQPGDSLAWAVAGRNRVKLEYVLGGIHFPRIKPDILIADSCDSNSIQTLACKTRVILTTVGPYAKYGSELVAACATAGTHYCDLCGEAHWIRQMIDRYQTPAEVSGARIVNSCGFDSIPSDCGVRYLNELAIERYGKPCSRIRMLVRATRGGASGGTVASMLNVVDEAQSDRSIARLLADPYTLNPVGDRVGPDGRDQHSAVFDKLAGVWTAPFIMEAINARIVRRSNAVLGYPWGRDFRYGEALMSGRGIGGRLKAMLISAGLKLFVAASAVPWLRNTLLQPRLPKPGEGPSRKIRESGFFNLLMLGTIAGGSTLRLSIKGDRDPGYGSTSKMLAESAVCLALDDLAVGGGFWTPASAMGSALLDRLTENAGLSFVLEQ